MVLSKKQDVCELLVAHHHVREMINHYKSKADNKPFSQWSSKEKENLYDAALIELKKCSFLGDFRTQDQVVMLVGCGMALVPGLLDEGKITSSNPIAYNKQKNPNGIKPQQMKPFMGSATCSLGLNKHGTDCVLCERMRHINTVDLSVPGQEFVYQQDETLLVRPWTLNGYPK